MRSRGSWRATTVRLFKILGVCLCLALLITSATYLTVPTHNTAATHFDTLIVLGAPPDPDGKASLEERERVLEAVREYRFGRASHMIMTGGAVTSQRPEAEVMTGVATDEGVPSAAVVSETMSRNTIENIYFSNELMKRNGWLTAEVISSPSHLPRAALILQHYDFGWRTKPAHWPPEFSWQRIGKYYVHEAAGTVALRWFGFRVNPFIPRPHDRPSAAIANHI